MTFATELRHVLSKITGRRARRQHDAKVRFSTALSRLQPGHVAIDLGANVGEFTQLMANSGADVFAFEPDPHAAQRLQDAVASRSNVTLIQAAAGTDDGSAILYRRQGFDREPDRASKSSSLFSAKQNVDPGNGFEVQVVDFLAFLSDLDRPVALLKMDIEGAEVDLMEAILASTHGERIDEIYVETHERKLPELEQRTNALRERTQGLIRPYVNWDWH